MMILFGAGGGALSNPQTSSKLFEISDNAFQRMWRGVILYELVPENPVSGSGPCTVG